MADRIDREIKNAAEKGGGTELDVALEVGRVALQLAQVHATLALASAMIDAAPEAPSDAKEWAEATR